MFALDFDQEDWKDWAKEYSPFVARQIYEWIFRKKVLDPDQMSNLPKALREKLKAEFTWDLLEIDAHLISKDESQKLLLKVGNGLFIETVIMPYPKRVTLCISSQVGCKMGCTFCQTGKMGFKKNLSSGEILAQIIIAEKVLGRRISNVVFMGMGEPLDNYDAVVKACRVMIDDRGLALAQSRVTVSTSGLVPEIEKLGKDVPVRLAISLHNADDAKRSAMMPVNRKYPLPILKEALINYPAPARYGITVEYVMIEGENDSIQDAKRLVSFLHGIKAKVNLIPINHFPGIEMHPSKHQSLTTFQKYLIDRSIPAPIRYSRGQDISGGCGQLSEKRQNEINMDPRVLRRQRKLAIIQS